MGYDADLADRIRELVGPVTGVTEQRMFGGLAFLVGGHLAVAASGGGGLLVRVRADEGEALLRKPGVEPMRMGGRAPMRGWLRVGADQVRTRRQLTAWVDRGVGYARSLPPKGAPPSARH